MKAAVAVLGASLLFFLVVLTGADRRESVPPPVAIPLGVGSGTAADPSTAPLPSPPDAPRGGAKTIATTGTSTPPPSSAPTARPTPSTPAGRTGPDGAPGTPPGTPAPAPPGDASTSTTSRPVGPGQVEEVDNQVDCTTADKKGKGRKDACPSPTTATTVPAGGGRGGR